MITRPMAAVLVLGIMSTGCATIYDPLRAQSRAPIVATQCGADTPKTYSEGIRCAQLVSQAYVDAMVDDAVTSDRVAIALIPIGAAAIGLGVSGVSGAPITGLALGGATIFGGGRWLTSQERRVVFGTGADACQCVIAASRPLYVPPGELGTARANLDAAVSRLEAQRASDLTRLQTRPPQEERTRRDLERLLRAADSVLATARAAQQRAAVAQRRIDSAGDPIVSAVQSIRVSVTRAAVGTAQDLRDLPDFLKSSVYGTFQDFTGLAAPAVRGEERQALGLLPGVAPEVQPLADAINAVRTATAALTAATDAALKLLDAVNVNDIQTEFAKCLDAVKGIKAPVRLRVSPSSLVRLAPGGSATILITGGKLPYTVVPLWSTPDLTITGPPETGAQRVEIKAGANLSGGPYFLSIRDESNDVEKTVRIEVVKTGNGAAAPATAASAAAPASDAKTIATALNRELPAGKWVGTKSAGVTWTVPAAAPWSFRLAFESSDAANSAANTDNVVNRIKTEPVDVSTDGSDLVVTVPEPSLRSLAEKASTAQWP